MDITNTKKHQEATSLSETQKREASARGDARHLFTELAVVEAGLRDFLDSLRDLGADEATLTRLDGYLREMEQIASVAIDSCIRSHTPKSTLPQPSYSP